MRLIDADRLLKPGFTDMFDEPVEMAMFSRYAIESQPTVKAIPIEYIQNIITWHIHLWEDGKDKMFITENVVQVVSHSMIAQVLSQLLEIWEKVYEESN